MGRNVLFVLPTLALLLFFWGAAVHGEEVIEHFQSDLQVEVDGTMQVVETITVIAEGQRIKRGIERNLVTAYRDRLNHRIQVRFDVLQVLRDGATEPWFIKNLKNGPRVYIGDKEKLIDMGRHTYEITYRTDRQLGYFEDHDELYWNVTGTGWALPVQQAVAYLYLPKSVPASAIGTMAYTGPSGAQGVDYDSGLDHEGVAWFRSTRALEAGEGLTIVSSWPKGHVNEPTTRERVRWLLQDNGRLLAGVLGALLLLAFYCLFRLKVGRDPQAGLFAMRYQPPENYSPASMRFVQRMGYDPKTFSAALVNLAANGHLHINQYDESFEIVRADSNAALASGEKVLLKTLFGNREKLLLQSSNHQVITKAMDAHKIRLEADYERKYFTANLVPIGVGIGISIAVLMVALFWPGGGADGSPDAVGAVFMTVWFSALSFALFTLLNKVVSAWREVRSSRRYASAILLTLFSLPIVGGWIISAGLLAQVASSGLVVLLACLIGLNYLFYHLMKAPAERGRALLDQIEGFRAYLTLREVSEPRLRNPPIRTPALFEGLLPYAIALDVEDVWGQQFDAVFAGAQREQGYTGPSWYSCTAPGLLTSSVFASSVGGALANSISSSSQAPKSSAGSRGGGSGGRW